MNDPVVQRFLVRSAAREAHLSAHGLDTSCSKSSASSNVVTLRVANAVPSVSPVSGPVTDGVPFAPVAPSLPFTAAIATVTPCVHPPSEVLPATSDTIMSSDGKTVSVDSSLHEPAVNVLTPDGVVDPSQESAEITELAAEEALLNPSFNMDI